MTDQNKLEELKRVIQEANPEIMKETFGFQFVYNGKVSILLVKRAGCVEYAVDGCNWLDIFTESKFDKCEKLGHRITLEDVLIVLKKTLIKKDGGVQRWVVVDNGAFAMVRPGTNVLEFGEAWILNKPLDDQSEATISWLHETLGGENHARDQV